MDYLNSQDQENGYEQNGISNNHGNSNDANSSHQLINPHGRPFQIFCPDCGKGFMKSGELKSHSKVHSDVRPFPCNTCHMSFKQQSHLRRHERIHTGEKPFACSLCDKSYTRSDRLKDHMRASHEASAKGRSRRTQLMYKSELNQTSHL